MNTTELIARLKLASEKATCGRWELSFSTDSDDAVIDREVEGFMPICIIEGAHPESGYDDDFQQEQQANAEFIALASPENVLALVEALESAQATAANSNRGWREAHEQEARAESAEKRVAELEESRDHYRAAYQAEEQSKQNMMLSFNAELCELLPGCQYMDPPDGGSVTPMEQVRRMVEDYRQRIAELEARTVTVTLPAHKYRECVNGLLEEAIAYAGTQQLRERLSSRLANFVQPDHPHTRCAAGIKCEVKGE